MFSITMNHVHFMIMFKQFLFYSFRDQLIGYVDTSPFEEDLHVDDSLMVVICQIPSDTDDQLRILTAQSVDFWNEVNKCRQRKIR